MSLKNWIPKSIRTYLSELNYKRKNKVKEKPHPYIYQPIFDADSIQKEIENFSIKPLISIIIPVYNVDPHWLKIAIESVMTQFYTNWEICIANDCSTNPTTIDYLKSIHHDKIKVVHLEKNTNISAASNAALALATGEYIGFLDNDDELTLDALFEVVKAINVTGSDFIYSDEDKLDMNKNFCSPYFKSDFSIDLFLSGNYICHFTVIKNTLIEQVGGFEIGLEGSQDYDLFLKCTEIAQSIHHIPKVLYHWRMIPGSTASEFSAKSYAQNTGKRSLENYLTRNGIQGEVFDGINPGSYRVKRAIEGNPLVSIIIPFQDHPKLLKTCIDSIIKKSTYKNFEIIGISNNSVDKKTFDLIKYFEKIDSRIKFYEYNVPFNYSKINNYAVTIAKGEHLILLNNDIEIITASWIEAMLEHSQRKEVGAVGAKLYYPNGKIQHAGVLIGTHGASHLHKLYPKNHFGYFGKLTLIQNLSAVTAACLMVKKSIYIEVNGLDEENLKIAYNDVDFCLKIREKNYLNVFTPFAEAFHHESISRGFENTPEKIERFKKEVSYFQVRHHKIISKGDPYFNPNFDINSVDFSLKQQSIQSYILKTK